MHLACWESVQLTFCFIRRHWVHTLLRVFLGRGAIGGVTSRSTEAISALDILRCRYSVGSDGFRGSLTIFDSVRRYVEGESGDVRDPAVDDDDLARWRSDNRHGVATPLWRLGKCDG